MFERGRLGEELVNRRNFKHTKARIDLWPWTLWSSKFEDF